MIGVDPSRIIVKCIVMIVVREVRGHIIGIYSRVHIVKYLVVMNVVVGAVCHVDAEIVLIDGIIGNIKVIRVFQGDAMIQILYDPVSLNVLLGCGIKIYACQIVQNEGVVQNVSLEVYDINEYAPEVLSAGIVDDQIVPGGTRG